MKKRAVLMLFGMLCLGLLATPALAGIVVLSDNFDSESLAYNYTSFANWNVTYGAVDLIGQPDFYDFLPGNGRYVDMDGSICQAGTLASKTSFTINAGDSYELRFYLAGNQRNSNPELLTATILTSSAQFTRNQNDGFALQTLWLHKAAGPPETFNVIFSHDGGDNVGLLLDRVELVYHPVPLPGALVLLGSGLLSLGLRGRRSC